MVDFSQMEFEERTVKPGWREIRILAPIPTDKPPPPDFKLTGNEARKRLIRYVLASASAFVPTLGKKLHRVASQMEREIDAEDVPS